jgi:hypothetical protein
MPFQAIESLVLLLLMLVASAGGCADTAPATGNGRLDLTVMPESLIASGRPLQGSFELRGLDRAVHASIAVDGAGYQTRSVALPPGVYSLRWRARDQPGDFSAGTALDPPEAPPGTARTVVIAPHRVTSLTVHSTLNAAEVPQPVAAVAASPEPNSRPPQP